jgi:hypothetical protein
MDRGHEKIWLGGKRASRTPSTAVQPSYFLFPAPAGGVKAKLGAELRREGRLISRTGMCKDRVGTVDELSERGFLPAFPPYLRHDRSRTRAQVRQVRLDQHQLTGLADELPRSGWRRPRIVEISDIFIS